MGALDGDSFPVDELSVFLKALASPIRLQILGALRVPKRAGDLRIAAASEHGGYSAERVLTRPAITEHLDRLSELGLVERFGDEGHYVVSQQRLFAIVGDLGRLARLRPVVELDVNETMAASGERPRALPRGAKLVLASGPREGDSFPLEGEGPWTVGRGAEAELRLEYDPHVSRVQLLVSRSGDGGFFVEVFPASKNATLLNYAEVQPGRRLPLLSGAILFVGSTRLVFQAV